MANKNGINEKVAIVELELMAEMTNMIRALRKLRTRHYDEAKKILNGVWDQLIDTIRMIPPEEGE